MNINETLQEREETHGNKEATNFSYQLTQEEKKKLYLAYRNMKLRCYNKNRDSYRNYGERGITVCEEWLLSRDKFIEWAISNGHKMHLSLDRIDNSKGYSPENCRWVDNKTQNRNQRRNKLILFNGKYAVVSEHAEDIGIKPDTLRKRIYARKMPLERAMTKANLTKKPLIHGSRTGYEKGCRCPDCRAFNAKRAREQRARRKFNKKSMEIINDK